MAMIDSRAGFFSIDPTENKSSILSFLLSLLHFVHNSLCMLNAYNCALEAARAVEITVLKGDKSL